MKDQSKNISSLSSKRLDEKIEKLQIKLQAFESELSDSENLLIELDKKKELGSSLFLGGSILLLLGLISSPICSTFVSISTIVWGLSVYFYGRSDTKKAQKKVSQTLVQISEIVEEIKSLKRKKSPANPQKILKAKE